MVNKFVSALFDFFFPKQCIGCGSPGKYICKKCFIKHSNINLDQYCHVCGKKSQLGFAHSDCLEYSYLDGLIFLTLFDEFPKKIIHEIKYNLHYDITNEVGDIMSEYLVKNYPNINVSDYVLFYVPQHYKKTFYRGFNQSELLANRISKNIGFEISSALKKVKITHSQVGLSRTEREENLKDSFVLLKNNFFKRNAIIIDDVYTTGATMNEISKILKQEGKFESVYGFVFAKSGINI